MMPLVRYAGYDPDEAPLELWRGWEQLRRSKQLSLARGIRNRIDARRAALLYWRGASWADIGELLAIEQGRAIRYTSWSVWSAVRRAMRP